MSWYEELIGLVLSGVTFVRDYVQLQFDPPPTLNSFTPLAVESPEIAKRSSEPGFANALFAQIGKVVREVRLEPGRSIEIDFTDGSLISQSLSNEDYVGPEAYTFFSESGAISAD